MWVFGYGSLMWDGWEKKWPCKRRTIATLAGYSRVFNKASTSNWGTAQKPCPTLNLATGRGSTEGMAFEFEEHARAGVMQYLRDREGIGFALSELPIQLRGEGQVMAIVPLYQGRSLIQQNNPTDLAAMALRANGKSGFCGRYIEGIAAELRKLSIHDRAVEELHAALTKARGTMDG